MSLFIHRQWPISLKVTFIQLPLFEIIILTPFTLTFPGYQAMGFTNTLDIHIYVLCQMFGQFYRKQLHLSNFGVDKLNINNKINIQLIDYHWKATQNDFMSFDVFGLVYFLPAKYQNMIRYPDFYLQSQIFLADTLCSENFPRARHYPAEHHLFGILT